MLTHQKWKMDVSVKEELSSLVEKMTHSGSPSLDETQLKKLKRTCRCRDKALRIQFMHQLSLIGPQTPICVLPMTS